MTLHEIEEKFKDLLDVAQRYSALYRKEKDRFPYRLNVIKELHDDENAHSRILVRLLQYKENGEYTWLLSFVNRLNDLCDGEANIEVARPIIDTEHSTGNGRIDGLVIEDGKYAIIIENKIWYAGDQYKQIDKYVKYVNRQHSVPNDNIYVVYLTLNGSKVVSDDSLSKETKSILGNRFIPMSFQYDILPWLENDVLPNCKLKERCLETALYQYIDYLKGLFGQLDYQKQAQKSAINQILKEMDAPENYTEIRKKYKEVQELATALENRVNELGKLAADKFQQLTREYFCDDIVWIDKNQIKYDSGYYQIFNKQWYGIKDLYPHLEWVPMTYTRLFESNVLKLVLHIEGDSAKKDKCGKILLEKAEGKNIKHLRKYKSTTYFSKEYSLKGKTFATMSDEEQRGFLHDIYGSAEIKQIIELMDETIAEMKSNK
ncbi:MAG: PD-(D/E)XK nuclease family protein [Bacteroidales bacterium]|nr:PD-(D/E)XK nuclease family protein [Bacteroidales bacterium]